MHKTLGFDNVRGRIFSQLIDDIVDATDFTCVGEFDALHNI